MNSTPAVRQALASEEHRLASRGCSLRPQLAPFEAAIPAAQRVLDPIRQTASGESERFHRRRRSSRTRAQEKSARCSARDRDTEQPRGPAVRAGLRKQTGTDSRVRPRHRPIRPAQLYASLSRATTLYPLLALCQLAATSSLDGSSVDNGMTVASPRVTSCPTYAATISDPTVTDGTSRA